MPERGKTQFRDRSWVWPFRSLNRHERRDTSYGSQYHFTGAQPAGTQAGAQVGGAQVGGAQLGGAHMGCPHIGGGQYVGPQTGIMDWGLHFVILLGICGGGQAGAAICTAG